MNKTRDNNSLLWSMKHTGASAKDHCAWEMDDFVMNGIGKKDWEKARYPAQADICAMSIMHSTGGA